jgi:hypothetical protein
MTRDEAICDALTALMGIDRVVALCEEHGIAYDPEVQADEIVDLLVQFPKDGA